MIISSSLQERLKNGVVHCAGGYLFEAERRGYLQAGSFVPLISLEHPDVLLEITRDNIRAGSDVVLAFTYYAHREKLRIIGKENIFKELNIAALKTAHQAADNAVRDYNIQRPLVAGNICNTNIYDPDDPNSHKAVRTIFREMIEWAAAQEVDFIQAETFYYLEEAKIALQEINNVQLPAVVMIAIFAEGKTRDGYTPEQACEQLVDNGSLVVGTNCFRGPYTILPILKAIAEKLPHKVYKAAMPMAYRTVEQYPTVFNLPDIGNRIVREKKGSFPDALESQIVNRYEITDFTKQAIKLGFRYIGTCCGGQPIHHRAVTESLGRKCIASKYSPDIEKHFMFGSDPSLKKHNTTYKNKA